MARKFSSVAVETTLSGTITSGATSMTVGSVTGWPSSPSVSAPYTVILDPDTASEEVVEVTGAAGTVLTIVRGVDGTTAKAHNAGAVVKHGVSARDFSEPADHIDNTTTAHGVSGAVVGTASTQTLTNKTIDASLNTISNITSAMITDGTIVNADINASAAIAASKIAGTAVTQADSGTVTSTMIVDGTIVDADVNASAAIAKTKIAGTAITAADTGTVTSTMIVDGTIVNADINAAAAIAVSKLASSSVTIGGATATLGGSNVTSLTGMTLDGTSTIGGVAGSALSSGWDTYAVTMTASGGGLNLGTGGSTSGRYKQVGKTVWFSIYVTFGSSGVNAGTGNYVFSLPSSAPLFATSVSGNARIYDSSASDRYFRFVSPSSTTQFNLCSADNVLVGAAAPIVFAASDTITIHGFYEAA